MLSSPFDIFGLLDRLKETAGPYLPEYGGILGAAAVLAVVVRTGLKLFAGKPASSGTKVNAAPDSGVNADSAGSGGEKVSEEERSPEKQQERQKEEELRKTQEQLKELFELFDEGKEKPAELQKTQEDKELEELGLERRDLENLKEQYKELVVEIAALIEKGLTPVQTAKALVSRTTEQIPVMELQPLIEAMSCFLKKNEELEKNTAVIGMDPLFEQKAALSALKRGDYETAFDFLERRADEAMNKADSSHRSDVRGPALEQAAALYRAVGVLARPVDPEKSFEALKKSKDCDHENAVTGALLARAYYESGKTKKAESLFENVAADTKENDYAVRYAAEMIPQIRTERAMLHARRIREEYENRLEETEGRSKTAQNIPLSLRKQTEVSRTDNRFVAEELRERGNERDAV